MAKERWPAWWSVAMIIALSLRLFGGDAARPFVFMFLGIAIGISLQRCTSKISAKHSE